MICFTVVVYMYICIVCIDVPRGEAVVLNKIAFAFASASVHAFPRSLKNA